MNTEISEKIKIHHGIRKVTSNSTTNHTDNGSCRQKGKNKQSTIRRRYNSYHRRFNRNGTYDKRTK